MDIAREVTKKIPGKRKIFFLQVGKSHLVARVRFRLSHADDHGAPSEEVILPSLFSRSRKMQLAISSKTRLQLLLLRKYARGLPFEEKGLLEIVDFEMNPRN